MFHQSFIAPLIVIFFLTVSQTLAVDPKITTFTSRTATSAWNVAWNVTESNVALCTAKSTYCCFKSGIIIPRIESNLITFTGAATSTGNACKSADLTISIEGSQGAASNLNPGSTSTIATGKIIIQDNIGESLSTNGSFGTDIYLIASDNSTQTPPSYAIQLPALHSEYKSISAMNILYLPVTYISYLTTSLSLLMITLLF